MNRWASASDVTVAIAQPTFLPWAGWFDLADQADVFVLLDDVAFSKQSWQQRNRIATSQGLGWITVPVRTSGRMGQRIIDTELASSTFIDKVVRTIATDYGRAAYFRRYFGEFCDVFAEGTRTGMLVDLNCALIDWLAKHMGVMTPRNRASELAADGRRGAYVAAICEELGGTRYMSPPGAEEYLVEDRVEFDTRSIRIELHAYEPPVYRQCFSPFAPYASALDLLLNEGDAAGDIMRSGRRPCRPLLAQTHRLEEQP
jgi:hypothetical protein